MQGWGQAGKKPQGEGLCCDHPSTQPSGIANQSWVQEMRDKTVLFHMERLCCRPAKTPVTHQMLRGVSWSLLGLGSRVSLGASSPVVSSGCRSGRFAGKIPAK